MGPKGSTLREERSAGVQGRPAGGQVGFRDAREGLEEWKVAWGRFAAVPAASWDLGTFGERPWRVGGRGIRPSPTHGRTRHKAEHGDAADAGISGLGRQPTRPFTPSWSAGPVDIATGVHPCTLAGLRRHAAIPFCRSIFVRIGKPLPHCLLEIADTLRIMRSRNAWARHDDSLENLSNIFKVPPMPRKAQTYAWRGN